MPGSFFSCDVGRLAERRNAMGLPDIVLVLIGVVIAIAVFVILAWRQNRTHALRDRFAEEYDRVLHEHGRTARR